MQTKKEVLENSLIEGNLMKLDSEFSNKWEKYYCYLSGSYIYFYKNDDIATSGYYYLKNVIIIENIDDYEVNLKNKYGMVSLRFENEIHYSNWISSIRQRSKEIKVSTEMKNLEIMDLFEFKGYDLKIIYCEIKINVTNSKAKIYDESISNQNEIFLITFKNLNINIALTEPDCELVLRLDQIKLFDYFRENQNFPILLDSYNITEGKDNTLVLYINSFTEKSPKYKGNLIEINILSDFVTVNYEPDSISKLLEIVAHCDQLRDEMKNCFTSPPKLKSMKKQFILPLNPPECMRIYCNKLNYRFLKLSLIFKDVKMMWLQKQLNHYFAEVITKELKLNLDYYIDHLDFSGSLRDTIISDCTNYPFTITKQIEYSDDLKNTLLCSKDNNKIEFEFNSYEPYCHLFVDNYASRCVVNLENIKLYYMQESFLRFYNYLLDIFLDSMGCKQEVKDYKYLQYHLPKKKKNEIDLLNLEVNKFFN